MGSMSFLLLSNEDFENRLCSRTADLSDRCNTSTCGNIESFLGGLLDNGPVEAALRCFAPVSTEPLNFFRSSSVKLFS